MKFTHPFRQIAYIFQEESLSASSPVALALSSIAAKLERLASADEERAGMIDEILAFDEKSIIIQPPVPQITEPEKQEKPDAKAQDQ